MKKFLAIALCALMVLALFACTASTTPATSTATDTTKTDTTKTDTTKTDTTSTQPAQNTEPEAKPFKVGVVLVGDENEGYTLAHINGIKEAAKNLGLDETDNFVWKYAIGEDETCKTAIEDCIDQGCTLVFTNSYGHQDYAQLVAEQKPDVQIVAMTGDKAKASGLANFHNAFTEIYEARFAAGVVAGMKIAELEEQGKLTDKNYAADGTVKVGYVGAYPYAEVVSGYTAFFLGIKSI